MSTLTNMLVTAAIAHYDQTDRANKPYILHPIEVMRITEREFGYDEELLMIAVGHDLIEDTEVTEKRLRALKFSDRVISGIVALSKDESKTYDEYKVQVLSNPDAMKVKYADLIHNTDLTRLSEVTEMDLARHKKYILFKVELELAMRLDRS